MSRLRRFEAAAPVQRANSPRTRSTQTGRCRYALAAAFLRAQVLAEERHDVVLEAVGHGAGVGAVIDLEAVGDAVARENVVKLAGVDAQAVLVANIHGDGAILAQIADCLLYTSDAADE